MQEIFDRIMKIKINQYGAIEEQTDTEFFVSGNNNTNAIYLYVSAALNAKLARVSFLRQDGFTIGEYQMSASSDLSDEEYSVFELTIKESSRILDIPGKLQLSFKIKKTVTINEQQIEQTIASPATCANVVRSISKASDIELAQQLYEASLQPVETVEESLNEHKLNFNNPHKVRGDQIDFSATDQTKVSTKINNLDTRLASHVNNKNNPHEVNAGQVKMVDDNKVTVQERIITAEGQIETNRQSIQILKGDLSNQKSELQQSIDDTKSTIEGHIADKNNPHATTGSNARIIKGDSRTIKDYVDNLTNKALTDAKKYADQKMSNAVGFVFGDLDSFKQAVKIEQSGDEEKGFTNLVSITSEEGVEFSADKLKIGETNVYLRQTEVPDYWLSTKEVNYQTDDPLVFFLPLEGESKIDLSSYVQKTDYPTSTSAGVIKVSAEDGLLVEAGSLKVNQALPEEIASRSGMKVITASNLPISSVGDNIQLTDGKITVKDKGYDPLAYHWTYNPSQVLSISSMPNRHFETIISTDDDFYLNTPNGKEYDNNNYKFFDFIKENAIHGNVQSDITITADLSSLFTGGEEITVNPVAFILYPSIQNYANIPEHSNYTSGLYLYSTVLHFNEDYLAELAVYIDQDSTTATFSLDIISGEYAIENITSKISTGLGSNYNYNKFTINEKDYTLTPEVITEKIITDLKTTQSNYSSLSSNYTSLDTRLTTLEDKVSKIPEIANNIDVNLASIKWEG